jgi:hypothetical protein
MEKFIHGNALTECHQNSRSRDVLHKDRFLVNEAVAGIKGDDVCGIRKSKK